MSTDAPANAGDARPLVGRPVSSRGAWLFGGALGLAGILLFTALEARRSAVPKGIATTAATDAGSLIAPPPALVIPGGVPGADDYVGTIDPLTAPIVPSEKQLLDSPPGPPRVQPPQSIPGSPIARTTGYYDPDPPYRPPVVGTAPLPTANIPPKQAPASGDRLAGGRVAATRLANPGATVPQGTVIQAVLETALDSNRPGFARAIVSRDVRSFDGASILIPRGSRLFGEYKSDLADSQKRAFVNWQTLTRPDGVQIALESPAADPLGRAGVGGKVDTHFFARFGGALLQSVLDLGVGVASRGGGDNNAVVIAPGSGISQTLVPRQQTIRPTLRVRQGSRVSVFVARDLDFSPTQ